MKKIIILILMVLLSACSFINPEGSNIETPETVKPPIYGKWVVTKYIYSDNLSNDNFMCKEIIGMDVLFANKEAFIAGEYIQGPIYKAKKINLGNYLYNKYNLNYEILSVENKDAYAISIKQSDLGAYEIIKVTEDKAFIFRNGFIFQISKSDDEIKDNELSLAIASKKDENIDASIETLGSKAESGLLLGLKIPGTSKLPTYNYKTIYIKFSDAGVENLYESSNILLPRLDGFSEVEIQRLFKENETTDNLIIKKRLDSIDESQTKEKPIQIEDRNVLKNIIYISDDIINIENYDTNMGIKKLRIYEIDKLESKKALEVKDFIDPDKTQGDNLLDIENRLEDPRNIGIFRQNGFWKLMGRNYNEEKNTYNDFDLNLVLPTSINKYNSLPIPMNEIKKFHSRIKDAFISPDNKFLITLENDMLKIYNIENGDIIENPLFEREIGDNADIIMSQWAMGRYSRLWQKEISRKN